MRKTVEILYHKGVPVDIWESRNGEPRQYGRAETPDRDYTVVRLFDTTKKSLPPEYFEFAGGKSRFKLDEAKMSVDEVALFKDKARFTHLAHAVKHTITPARLAKLYTNNSVEWEAYKADVERPELGA